jgi:hypothetical protein
MMQKYVHMYINAKIIPVETISGMGDGIRRAVEGMNSSMIHCKNLCKYHSVPPPAQQ